MNAAPGMEPSSGQALLTSLLTQQLDAVVVTDVDFTITEFAGGAERLCGRMRADVLGQPWFTTIPTEIRSPAAEDVWPHLREGREIHAEIRIDRPDGTCVDLDVSATPLRDAAGRLTGWLGIGRDLSEARLAERRERERRAQLELAWQAEEHLRLSQERLARVLESAGVVYFDHDLVTGHAYRSPELARLLGCTPADIPPTVGALESRLHPDDVARRQDDRAAILGGEQGAGHSHYRLRHRDGHWIWVAVLASVVERDRAGRPSRVGGLIVDITRQKALESSVLDREARLRAFFDSPGVGVVVARPDGVMVDVNDRACDIFGYSREDLAQLTWRDITFPDDLDADADEYARMAAGEIEHYSMDKRYRRKDGRIVWCLLSVSCVRAGDGSIQHAVGIIMDITRRKEAEQKLRESETMFRTVVEEASDAIHLFDLRTGRITVMNARYAEQAGFSQDELRAMAAPDALAHIHPDDRERVVQHLEQLLAGDVHPAPIEYRWRTKAGEYRWISHTRSVIRGDAGQPVAFVGVSQDITDRKRAEEAIRAALTDNASLIASLRQQLASNTLASIMPICMSCRKIRDERNRWETLEDYILEHTASLFSHGMCPECAQRFLDETEGRT